METTMTKAKAKRSVCHVVNDFVRSASVRRFPETERKLLLCEPGINAQVVARLEQAGFHSLDHLKREGVASAVLRVCSELSTIGWATRRKPLERAVARLTAASLASPPSAARTPPFDPPPAHEPAKRD